MTMRARLIVCSLLLALPATAAPKKKKGPSHHPPVTTPAPAPETTPPPAETTPPPATETATPAPTPPPPPPAPTPPPPAPEPQASSKSVDLESLANEYNQLRDELFRSRAKAHLLGDTLFKTKMLASFVYKAQRAWPLKKITLRIDDQPVASLDTPAVGDPLKLYDGFITPGKHTLTLHVECGAVGEDRVGYGSDGNFTIDVAENKLTVVRLSVDESGDGPSHLAKKKEGSFDVRVRADLEVQDRK
jgi:hypothetical protein